VPAAPVNAAWSVRNWQSGDGLPNNNVTGLAQTPDGYLWVATPSQLARFDGVRFDAFSSPAVVPGYNQKAVVLLRSRTGGLWLGLNHGPVVYLNDRTATVFTNNLPDLAMQALTEDAEGNLWITYRGEAVTRIEKGRMIQATAAEGLPGGTVCSLAMDGKGRLWFAKGGQIGVFRNGRFDTLLQLGGFTSTVRLAGSSAGGVWICFGVQLYKYDEGGKLEAEGAFQSANPVTQPNVVFEDRNGGVWIGTSSSGLFRYDGSHFERLPVSHLEILSLLEDAEGNLWVGTGGGGLDRVQPRAMGLESAETGLPFETVQSLYEDKTGVLWAATQNGLLACRSAGGWSTLSTNTNWPGGRATCVTADRSGAVWIGTMDYALHCWKDGVYSSWYRTNGLACRNVHTVLASAAGDLWIGGNAPDSLQCLHAGQLSTVKIPPDIQTIRTMAEDAAGNIWIGTVKGVLLRVHDGQAADETTALTGTRETVLTPGTPLSIRCLHTTPDGSLWIGYAGAGLGWLKDGRFVRFTLEQGLHDDYISQVVADGRGWLWFGADHGIFKVRQQEFEDVAAGRAARVRSICYGRDEGLPNLQANFGNSPGAIRSRDGKLWIPMRSALAVVDPGRLRENPDPPPVLLKRVMVDDRTVASYGGALPVGNSADLQAGRDTLRLLPAHRRLEFEFTALDLVAPENVQFRYRLKGFDNAWIEAGTERSARYSRLPSGKYHFEVSACNSEGIWSRNNAGVEFLVTPFFWQAWWFRFTALVLLMGSTIGIVRYVSFRRLHLKLRALEQQAALDRERSRIARDLHDDLGSRLTKIALLTDLARDFSREPDKAGENARQASETARQVIKSLDETVWAVNPRNDTLPHLVDYIGQFAVDFLQTAGVRCRVDLPRNPPDHDVSAEARHNLFLLVKEALNNVVRHATATEVCLRITANNKSVELTIEDNGQGFEHVPDDALADGLRNMRQRIEEIGGQFHLESRPGAGTRIGASIPCRHWK